MVDHKRNTMCAKLKRIVCATVMPISKRREGKCIQCGACCKLPFPCPFLSETKKGYSCLIYQIRPASCRKYPRTESEWITQDTCGYTFRNLNNTKQENKQTNNQKDNKKSNNKSKPTNKIKSRNQSKSKAKRH